MNEIYCSSCGRVFDDTKKTEQPLNLACPTFDCRKQEEKCCKIYYTVIPASLGDDSLESEVAPHNGDYYNRFVKYEVNGHIYFYTTDGIPVNLTEKEVIIDDFFSYVSKNPVENRKLTAALNNYFTEEEWAAFWE